MKKVVIINVNGRDIKVEEDGYTALQTYLKQAEKRLSRNPDKDEILSDFEQAIAEKCNVYIDKYKTVVTGKEIDTIIKEMGPVEVDDEKISKEETIAAEKPQKKLYQIKEGAWISGVCSGLALYFSIDVTIVRLIFVLLAFVTHGLWIFVYIIMMFVIPWAKTPEQKAHARGEEFSADEFFKKASKKYEDFRTKHVIPESVSREQFVTNWRLLHHFGNKVLALLIGFFTGLLIWFWIASLISIFTTSSVFGYTLGESVSFWIVALYVTSVFFLLFWPLKLWIRRTLVAAEIYKKELKKSEQVIALAGWIGWILAIALFVVLSITYAQELSKNIIHFQQVLTHGQRPAN